VRNICTPVLFGDAGVLLRVAEENFARRPAASFPRRMAEDQNGDGPLIVDCATIDARKIKPGRFRRRAVARLIFTSNTPSRALAGKNRRRGHRPIHKEALQLAGVKFPATRKFSRR